MPSSDGEHRLGTIFMGPTPDRETTLDKLYAVAQRDVWNKRTEDEYMERVKARATEQVRALLLQARKRGDEILTQAESRAGALRAEAEHVRAEADTVMEAVQQELEKARSVTENAEALRETARQEGFQAGHEEAMAQLMQDRQALGETTAVVLISIQEQCAKIFDAWREDLAALLREAVTKGTGWIVDNARAEVLDALLDQSVRALLDKRHFTVRVNPADAALVTDMLADAHKAGSRTLSWELATDPALEPGSLIVESDAALVDNSRKARQSVVDEVLQHLSLPAGQVDQAGFENVTNTLVSEMRQHGIDLQEAGEATPEFAPASPDFAPAAEFSLSNIGTDLTADLDTNAPQDVFQPDAFEPAQAPFAADPVADSMVEAQPQFDAFQPEEAPSAPAEMSAEMFAEAAPTDSDAAFDPTSIFDNPAPLSPEVAESAAEAENLVAEFLDEPAPTLGADREPASDNALPPDVADDLLAEMGFGPSNP